MHNLAHLFNQAISLHQSGNLSEAINLYLRVLPFQKDNAELLFTIGTAYCQLGKPEEGLNFLRKSSRINPKNFHVFGNIGTLLAGLRRFDEAIINYNKALLINQNFPEGLFGRANALVEMKAYSAAIVDYETVIALLPNFAIAHCNKGKAQFELGQYTEALLSYKQAINLAPDLSEAYCNQGHALQEIQQFDEAIESYSRAISLNPNLDEAWRNLAIALYITGRHTEALESLEKALATQPNFVEARWMKAMFALPIIPDDTKHALSSRDRFKEALNQITLWFTDATHLTTGYKAVSTAQPYYLAYQEYNNRELLSEYGALCSRLMQNWQVNVLRTIKLKPGNRPIKLGIVSNHIYQHSVWDALISGWIEHLERIHLTVFSSFKKNDSATKFAQTTKTELISCNGDLTQWIDAIHKNQIDALLYPELGMDAMAIKLASMRLAPVQIASWGHPETTGLPTVDYYLSADLLEPETCDENYAEQLIKLPNLGCCIKRTPVAASPLLLEQLGISADQPLFICPGTPFKYQPFHDHVFVEIAQRLGKCKFVFFAYRVEELTLRLKRRIGLCFSKAGLNLDDYCIFLPWQPKDSFYGLMGQADVYLDTIGFSGFNTALQAIECELPIVTLDGRFMRGRLASGILKRMGLTELVAANHDEYINLAVKLASDKNFNLLVRQKIIDHSHVLYGDLTPIRALEDFVEGACRPSV